MDAAGEGASEAPGAAAFGAGRGCALGKKREKTRIMADLRPFVLAIPIAAVYDLKW